MSDQGIFPGLTFEAYRALPGISITQLKAISVSPKHYAHRLANPLDTKPLTLGRAAHMAVLEPDRFASHYRVWDQRTEAGDLRPRRGKDWEAFKAAAFAEDREIVSEDEWNKAAAISKAIRSDGRAMKWIGLGQPEVSMQWIGEGGVQCKGRPDWLTHDAFARPTIVGLKTARDIRMRDFGAQATRLGFIAQWAHYHDGFATIERVEPRMIEIIVESSPPHDIAIYEIPDDVLDLGRSLVRGWFETLDRCLETGEWPGAMPGEVLFSPPKWAWPGEEGFEDASIPLREDDA